MEAEKMRTNPYIVHLEEEKYAFCTCNSSKKNPFCDGTHKGSELKPFKVEIKKSGSYSICKCSSGRNGFFCDGTHARL